MDIASAPITKQATTFIGSSTNFASFVFRSKAQYRCIAYNTTTSVDSSAGLLTTKFSDQGAGRLEWATTLGFKAYCVDGTYVDSPTSELVIFAHDDGYIYEFDGSADRDGSNISAVYESPFIIVNDPQTRKTLYKMALFVQTTGLFSVRANIIYDFYKLANYNQAVAAPRIDLTTEQPGLDAYGEAAAVYGVAIFGSRPDGVYDTNLVGSGKTFSVRIEDISTNPPAKLDSIVFELRQHDRQ